MGRFHVSADGVYDGDDVGRAGGHWYGCCPDGNWRGPVIGCCAVRGLQNIRSVGRGQVGRSDQGSGGVVFVIFLKLLFSLFIVAFGAWGCLAISFQIRGLVGALILICWAGISMAALYGTWFDNTGNGWLWAYLLSVVLFLFVWVSLPARLDRNWVPELQNTVSGTVDGAQGNVTQRP